MALADICKEEVDPLLAQIRNIMEQQEQNAGTSFIDESFSDNESTLIDDQLAAVTPDKSESENYNNKVAINWKNLEDSEHILSSVTRAGGKIDHQSTTVDALMRDLLTPLLKNWLEVNLSPLVKEIVETKIEKLITEYRQTFEQDSK